MGSNLWELQLPPGCVPEILHEPVVNKGLSIQMPLSRCDHKNEEPSCRHCGAHVTDGSSSVRMPRSAAEVMCWFECLLVDTPALNLLLACSLFLHMIWLYLIYISIYIIYIYIYLWVFYVCVWFIVIYSWTNVKIISHTVSVAPSWAKNTTQQHPLAETESL